MSSKFAGGQIQFQSIFNGVFIYQSGDCAGWAGCSWEGPNKVTLPLGYSWDEVTIVHELTHIWNNRSGGKLASGYAMASHSTYDIGTGRYESGPGLWDNISREKIITSDYEDLAYSVPIYVFPRQAEVDYWVPRQEVVDFFNNSDRYLYIQGLFLHPS